MKEKIISAAAVFLMLTGCGDASSSGDAPSSSEADRAASISEDDVSEAPEAEGSNLNELSEKLMSASNKLTGSSCIEDELFQKNCNKLFGFGADMLLDGAIVYNDGGGLADEVTMIVMKDGNTEYAKLSLEGRKELRYNDFKGYVPEELPKIEAGKVFAVGDTAVLIISDEQDKIEKIIKEHLNK